MEVDANPLGGMDESQHGTLGPIEQQHAAIHLTVMPSHMEVDANQLVISSHMEADANQLVMLSHMEVDANPLGGMDGIQHGIRGPTAQQHAAILLTVIIPHLEISHEVAVLHLEPL